MALPLLGQECPSRGFFQLCSSQLSPCSRTSLRSEVPGHARDLYVLGFLGHPVKWECQGFLASLFDPWCWISKLPTLAFKDIASSVLLSGINWFPPPLHFLERVLWSSSLDPCLLFKFLGIVKKMCLQQVYRQHGQRESRLGHESAGLGSTLNVSGHGFFSFQGSSSVASVPIWKISTLWAHCCLLWALMELHVHVPVVIPLRVSCSWT